MIRLLALSLLAMTLAVSACGKRGDPSPPSATEEEAPQG